MNIVEFHDVHRAYTRVVDILRGLSLEVEAGQVVGLLGRNGAGKTTLLRLAMGMLEAQQGTVRVFGLDPRRQAVEVKRRVGYVSEEQILPPFLRVNQVIQLHSGLFPSWDPALAERLMSRFEMPLKSKIKELSKGQARQVALLCAVAHRPELLLLDEPAAGSSPPARREFLETSIQLLNEEGTTILFSSHHMTDVERLADRIEDRVGEFGYRAFTDSAPVLEKALARTLDPPAELAAELRSVRDGLYELRLELMGDSTVRGRSAPVPLSIVQRVRRIIGAQWSSSSAPTGTSREALRTAGEAFASILERLHALDADVRELEDGLEDAGAPATPGRLPRWKPVS